MVIELVVKIFFVQHGKSSSFDLSSGGFFMIAITGGGTGGHIFPNISVIEELKKRGIGEFYWIGERGGREQEWADRLQIDFYGIKTGKLRRYFSMKNFADVFRVLIGIFQSLRIMRRVKPDILFSKGGFVSVPPAIAAWLLRIPVVTHESDMHPGLATKIIARVASIICVSWEKTSSYFANKTVVYTGNPLREVIKKGSYERGLSWLRFREKLPVVTVFGGSLGASSVNRAVWEMYSEHELHFNLVHQCGRGNLKEIQGRRDNYKEYEFLYDEIGDVIAASDLLISRAGAGALYEIGALKRPAILIPLPLSKSRGEQIRNAAFFEENAAAWVIDDRKLDGNILYETILKLLNDKQNLQNMGENAGSLCKSDAQSAIVDILQSMLKKRGHDR